MHATVRQHNRIEKPAEVIREGAETSLPTQREIPGFVSYSFVDVGEAGGRMISLSVLETEDGTAESDRLATAWVDDRPNLIPPAESAEAAQVLLGD